MPRKNPISEPRAIGAREARRSSREGYAFPTLGGSGGGPAPKPLEVVRAPPAPKDAKGDDQKVVPTGGRVGPKGKRPRPLPGVGPAGGEHRPAPGGRNQFARRPAPGGEHD